MFELATIDEQPFIKLRIGSKSETLSPSDAVTSNHLRINEAEIALRALAAERCGIESDLHDDVFAGNPTGDLRAKLADIDRQIGLHQSAITSSREQIKEIHRAVDKFNADRRRKEHAAHLAALTEPFDQILKECQL